MACARTDTSQPLRTTAPASLMFFMRISCRIGRSMTRLGVWPRRTAGEYRSKVANHSFEMPSFSPFFRSPITLPRSRISCRIPGLISDSASSPFDAIWIGPPNGRYSRVRSKTSTSHPADCSVTAVHSPPIPPPAITAFNGLSLSLSAADIVAPPHLQLDTDPRSRPRAFARWSRLGSALRGLQLLPTTLRARRWPSSEVVDAARTSSAL